MRTTTRHLALAAASVAVVLTTAACGGGGNDAAAQASASPLDAERANGLARRRPPPPPPAPPPAPATDATLALASATASSQPADGNVCAVSANGGKVLFTSYSDTLVVGNNRPFTEDIFLKDFNGNGVTSVVTMGRSLTCLTMTPDANTVVFIEDQTDGRVDVLGNSGTELAIVVRNLSTGQKTRVTPLLSTFPNVDSYQFAGISDDGSRVAFIAQPTRTCSGYDCTANGPARMLLRDLASGSLINLESQVRFTTSQGLADGNAWLSPNGRTLAFSSRAAYPEVGDATSTGRDVYAFDIAGRSVRLVSTDAAGRQLSQQTLPGFQSIGPSFGVQTFLANSSMIAFFSFGESSAGPGGVYVKNLSTGALNRVLDSNLARDDGYRAFVSFSDDGRKVAYVEDNGIGGQANRTLPRVVDLTTGARVNAATLTNGTVGNGNTTTAVLLSRDGKTAAFANNSTNLLGGLSPLGGAELRAYRKLLP